MSYVKTQWVNGDTITADKLNHIEAGIEANETENSLLKSQLELGTDNRYGDFKPGYIACPSVGSTATLTRTNSAEVKSAIIPCVPGETAVLNIIGGGTSSGGARAFMVCDNNLTVLVRAATGETYDHRTVMIPEGGAYLVVNNLINSQPNPSVMIGDYAFTHNSDLFTVDIPFPMAAFRANATITDAGNFVTGRPSAITVAMTLPEPVIVYANTGYTFRYFEPKSDGSFYFAQYQTKRFIPANTRFFTVLYVGREESQNVTLDDTVFFRILCSPDTAKYIENLFTTEFSAGELTYTTPTSVYVNTIARGSFDTTRKLRMATAPYRRTTDLIKATVPFLVQSGYSTNTNPGVYVHKINDDLTVSTVQIPTNTRAVFQPGNYIIEFYNSNTSFDTSINRYIRIMAVSEQAEITSFVSQLGSPASGGCASAFFDNSFNLWMIRHTAQTMFVRKTDNTYTEDIALGMTCGHANNMAFYDDMAWVSDWYLPKIYRFEIDSELYTATYVDTIDMPTDGINGYVQYIPISDSEIIAVTWDSPRDVFYVVRYVKERITGEYREQARFPVTSVTSIIQGFAYFDGYVFILCDNDNNNNVGVQIVNLATQDMVFIPSSYTAESESIVSIEYCKNLSSGNDLVNVVICYEQGQLYQLQFKSMFLP